MRFFPLLYLLFCSTIHLIGQSEAKDYEGVVSFKSSQNVYVKFEKTKGIEIGDTLYIWQGNQLQPVLEVKHISSISCVCVPISAVMVNISDILVARSKSEPISVTDTINEKLIDAPTIANLEPNRLQEDPSIEERKEKIRGRFSLSSYTYFSNTEADNSQRMRYTFSLNATNISNSRFSLESYVIFRHKAHEWNEVKRNLPSALKVYNFAVKYEPDDHTQIVLGRKFNSHVSNIGAIDGLQVERRINQFTVGAIVGTRPNLQDYSLNMHLLQYGGFVSHEINSKSGTMQTSAAVIEQKSGPFTDRRFAYFQHSNSLLKNLNLFTSLELDLYMMLDEVPTNTIRPTSAYVSLRYKASKKLSLSASFDARKNVIYYESYKNFIDQLIEQETRQGFRFRFNYRPIKYVTFGSSAGYRSQKGSSNVSKNLYSFLTFNRIPWLGMSATISSTLLETSYLTGGVYGIRLSKSMMKGRLFSDIDYRIVNYKYGISGSKLRQSIVGINLSGRLKGKLSLSISYESTIEQEKILNRVYATIIQRF